MDDLLGPVDHHALGPGLRHRGFVPPSGGFLALVVRVPAAFPEAPCRSWDWEGTGRGTGWWPASTVKVFAAAAALGTARRHGFGAGARVRFDEPGGPFEDTLGGLVGAALRDSDNAAFDRLAWLAGHRALQGWLGRHGFRGTSLWRGYSGTYRDPATGNGTLTRAPALALREGGRGWSRGAARDRTPCDVPGHGNRTTPRDLALFLLRVARHRRLPPAGRMGLRRADLAVLAGALAAPKPRGNGVAEGLREAFPGARLLHKPGYACDWFSDAAFVDLPAPEASWIVVLAGRPGRDCLDDAAARVGRLLAAGFPGPGAAGDPGAPASRADSGPAAAGASGGRGA